MNQYLELFNIDEIIIDKALLKAIGADSRIQILKSLSLKRKTQSELAEELKLSQPTVLEHLDYLIKANLIVKVDEGRKWKYYKLTKKGEALINQQKTPIQAFILLSIGTILGIFAIVNLFGAGFESMFFENQNQRNFFIEQEEPNFAYDNNIYGESTTEEKPLLTAKAFATSEYFNDENKSFDEKQLQYENEPLNFNEEKKSIKVESIIYTFLIFASIYLIYKGSIGLKKQKI